MLVWAAWGEASPGTLRSALRTVSGSRTHWRRAGSRTGGHTSGACGSDRRHGRSRPPVGRRGRDHPDFELAACVDVSQDVLRDACCGSSAFPAKDAHPRLEDALWPRAVTPSWSLRRRTRTSRRASSRSRRASASSSRSRSPSASRRRCGSSTPRRSGGCRSSSRRTTAICAPSAPPAGSCARGPWVRSALRSVNYYNVPRAPLDPLADAARGALGARGAPHRRALLRPRPPGDAGS